MSEFNTFLAAIEYVKEIYIAFKKIIKAISINFGMYTGRLRFCDQHLF